MSLMVFKESESSKNKLANDLDIGTWFIDQDNQVFVIVLDDRTHEKRVLCSGNYYKPFIANVSPKSFTVKKILEPGTLLQVSTSVTEGGENV